MKFFKFTHFLTFLMVGIQMSMQQEVEQEGDVLETHISPEDADYSIIEWGIKTPISEFDPKLPEFIEEGSNLHIGCKSCIPAVIHH